MLRYPCVQAPDIATAPNVRGWGTRQFVVSLAFWYALYSGEKAAYECAMLGLLGRVSGDIVHWVFEKSWWRVAVFSSVEPLGAYLMYVAMSS